MEKEITRRSFVGAAGAMGTAAVASTLLSAATAGATEAGSKAADAPAGTAAPADDLLYTASINPQDTTYRTADGELTTLFSPLTIGSMTINNRMVKSAAGSATYLAGLTDELFQYYVNFAKGGVELIWVEGEAPITPDPETGELSAEALEFGQRLVAACAEYGAHLGYQWAPFGTSVADDAMTVDQIHAIQASGVAIAKGLKEMGFEAIEMNAAGFNQGEQFLSRFYNTRTDEYGFATIENRARFVTEWIEQVKAEVGEDFNVQILINCIEDQDNLDNNATLMNLDNTLTAGRNKATTVEEGIALCKYFEAAGADSLHLRLGPLGNHPCQFGSDLYFILNGVEGATGYGTQYDFSKHWQGKLDGSHSGAGMLLDVVKQYKEALSIPCGTVTYMDPAHAPDFFEAALAEGKVDFLLMTRPLTVDPDYVNKLREGRIDEIAPCTRCLHCHIGSNEMNRQMGYCRVNALTQRVMTETGPATYELEPAATPKKVMVVGGGPAGMEAARIAAARGHDVTLYEKNGMLGGLLDFAAAVKGPHENLADLKAYLERQCELAGVNVVLNTEVTAELVASEAPDTLILACGGARVDLALPGTGPKVVAIEDFMFDGELGDNVVVYGSNAQAFDTALWLTVHKKHITMVTPSPVADLDMQQSMHAHRFMTTALYALGMQVYTSAEIKACSESTITVASADAGVEYVIACDSIVNAADMKRNAGLLDEVDVPEAYTIGDCFEPFNIAMAIRSGNDAGRGV
ncbi:MAG: FAD-dependent oxidoreductase [Coriobacteriia bacterium]|nr:FAD-dependent oxidoreductase [Coriobacteriia bacterium]MBS5478550.1 FAD-dependent oxidoreductase [Coriobacteriia bacterium]